MHKRAETMTLTERAFVKQQIHQELSFVEQLKLKLQIILEEVLAEKQQLERRFQIECSRLREEIDTKNSCIQKLQQRVRYLQGENQQIRYQFDQRLSLMGILKNQNALITKENARQKEQVRLTIQSLLAQNRQLKHAIIQKQYKGQKIKRVSSRNRITPFTLFDHRYYSCKNIQILNSNDDRWAQMGQQVEELVQDDDNPSMLVQSRNDECLSKSSVMDMIRQRRDQIKQSRVTQIKGRNNNYQSRFGLEKMSTKTHLSRQRTAGGRFQ